MDIRSDWMTNTFSIKENTISKAKKMFDKQRYESAEGYEVLINGVLEQVLIQNHSNPINNSKLTKHIHCDINSIISSGSIVDWNNDKYLVLSQIENNLAYLSAKIQKCNQILKWKDSDDEIIEQYCIISKSNLMKFNIDDNRYDVNTLDGSLFCFTPINDKTLSIVSKQRFYIGRQIYEVVGYDDVTNEGLIQFSFVLATDNVKDDKTNMIADNSHLTNNGGGLVW